MSNRLQSTRLQSIRLPVKLSTINSFQSNRLLNSFTELVYIEKDHFIHMIALRTKLTVNYHECSDKLVMKNKNDILKIKDLNYMVLLNIGKKLEKYKIIFEIIINFENHFSY